MVGTWVGCEHARAVMDSPMSFCSCTFGWPFSRSLCIFVRCGLPIPVDDVCALPQVPPWRIFKGQSMNTVWCQSNRLWAIPSLAQLVSLCWQEPICVCIGQIWPRLTERETVKATLVEKGVFDCLFQIQRFSRCHIWRPSGTKLQLLSDVNIRKFYFHLSLHILQVSKQSHLMWLFIAPLGQQRHYPGGEHTLGMPWCILLINSRQLPPSTHWMHHTESVLRQEITNSYKSIHIGTTVFTVKVWKRCCLLSLRAFINDYAPILFL